jgi:glycosyltransferase involved in cell wall biosynthesis
MDIVIIGIQPWYFELGSNCKNIALQLAKDHRVLYINMPLDRKTVMRNKHNPTLARHLQVIRGKEDALVKIQDNLFNYYPHRIMESINWIPSDRIFGLFNRINSRRFALEIADAVKAAGFGEYILFNDNDIFRSYHLKELLHPKLYVYYSRDNLLATPYWGRHGKAFEPGHIAKADLGFANSVYLANYLKKYNPNSYYIGQGCNIDLFRPDTNYPVPDDIAHLSHPIIGYAGAILNYRIDMEIIRHIARSMPDWNIVLVGPEDESFATSDLHSMPNVHFPGRKDISTLPAYIAAFDVCMNPQLLNEMTIGNYPLKIDEYLAMGKPAVATRTDAMQIFEDYVYMGEKPGDYPALIRKALDNDNPALRQRRIAFARTHTWENSVGELLHAIEKTINHS